MTDIAIERADGVLRLTFTCPDRLNSVTTEMLDAITAALADSEGVRVAVLSGEGRAFCSGAVMVPGAVDGGILEAADRAIHALTGAPFPVVAAVNGLAAGIGSSLALACDLQVTRESGYFLQAFINVGLMGDGGAHALLAASVGRARATRLLMLGERLTNPEALAAGLVSHCVPDEEWQATVDALVEKLATGPTLAYSQIKSTIGAATLTELRDVISRETKGQTMLGSSADHREGVQAFSEKRPANFTGA